MKEYIRTHRYVLLMLYLPVFLIWFAVLEHAVSSPDMCWVSYLPIDDKIPFLPAFILAYVTWYPYLLVPALILLFKEEREPFIRYAAFIIAGFSISLLICSIWPNCQNLRPTDVDTSNLFGFLIQGIYSADTPTNVLPSMHVVGSMAVISASFDSPTLRKARWPIVIWGLLICASTVFVKQHSILDVFAALALALILHLVIYQIAKRRMSKKQVPANQ